MGSAKHIVIVDDDEAFRYVLQHAFENAGWTTRTYEDWTGVLEYFEEGGPADLLLADLRLPSGTPNGVSLARMAAKRRGTLKIAFVTAHEDLTAVVPAELGPVISKELPVADIIAAADQLTTGAA